MAIFAVVWDFIDQLNNKPGFVPSNFWSLFTNHSNLIAGGVLLVGAIMPASFVHTHGWDLVRGAAVTYMVTTGVVYAALIGGLFNPFADDQTWMNSSLHQIIPIVMLLDLIIRPPATRLTIPEALTWLSYPLLFLIYSLIRGPMVDWYPYSFLTPEEVGGYAGVALYSVGILTGILLVSAFIVRLSRIGQAQRDLQVSGPLQA
jgi:hypothetical protein